MTESSLDPSSHTQFLKKVTTEIGKALIGQHDLVERIMIGFLTKGHVLLEGVPGLAKTLAVQSVADVFDLSFRRIQFTPDLLPTDLTGTMVFDPRDSSFSPRKGPIFANIILADEINRAPAKVQSALLESMQEQQVTIGETTHALEDPFLVLATQNPIEQEGTYPLPEAQVDRFLLKVCVEYPSFEEERLIINRLGSAQPPVLEAVAGITDLIAAREAVEKVFVDEKIKDYILRIIFSTRDPGSVGCKDLVPLISVGASPRGSLGLYRASKAYALVQGRAYVVPQDVTSILPDILRHRLSLTYEADAQGLTVEAILERLMEFVPAP